MTITVLENMLVTISNIQNFLHKQHKFARYPKPNMVQLLQDMGDKAVDTYINGLQDVTRHLKRSNHPLCLKIAEAIDAHLHVARCASAGLEVQRILRNGSQGPMFMTPEATAMAIKMVQELDQQLERLYSDFGFVPSHQVVPTLYDTSKLCSIDAFVQEHGPVCF